LLKEINDLRIKVNELEVKLKDRDRVLQEFKREKRLSTSVTKGNREQSSTHIESVEVERRHTR
jgi:hypothetical protein